MGWTVTARISYDDDRAGVTTKVTNAMHKIGFLGAGTGIWQCICKDETRMQEAVNAVTGSLTGLDEGVTLDHVFLTVVKRPGT